MNNKKIKRKAEKLEEKAKKVIEAEEILNETIVHWNRLATEILLELCEAVDALKLIGNYHINIPEEHYGIVRQARVIQRALNQTSKKAELLRESIIGAGQIMPINEREATVVGVLRKLDDFKLDPLKRDHRTKEIYEALTPLFDLAKEKFGFSLPYWLVDRLRLEELKKSKKVKVHS